MKRFQIKRERKKMTEILTTGRRRNVERVVDHVLPVSHVSLQHFLVVSNEPFASVKEG
jgi:hypothetical protein